MKKILLISLFTIITTGCSEFALLASAGGMAASQNTYAKIYNGVDFMTFVTTEKSIKKHIYDKGREHVQTFTRFVNDKTIRD